MSDCSLHCLKLNNISVTVGGAELLRNVSLHAHCGELTAVIGRNGAGKSTLLKALLDDIPHSGTIEFSGHGDKPGPMRPRIGYVPQSISLDEGAPATVYDLLVSLTSSWPVFLPRRKKLAERLRKHLERFQAGDLLDKPIGRLSGGELQRTLLAAAMLPQPDLLILDEPVSGVDRAGLNAFYELVETLRADADMVILLVSHDLEFVRKMADRVVLLDRKVLEVGTPAAVFSSAAFRDAF